jgi:hypothetical protein
MTGGPPIGEFLAKIKVALLIFAFGSAVDLLSTWRCLKTITPREGHEVNLIVVFFVRHFGMAAGLVGCKLMAAVVVLASSVTLGHMFPRHVTDYRLAETLFVALGCIYLAAGVWNTIGLANYR